MDGSLFEERQGVIDPAARLTETEAAVGISDPQPSPAVGRQVALCFVMAVHRQAELFQMVLTLHTPSGFPGRLHGGQEQRHQNADDGNHDQKFD